MARLLPLLLLAVGSLLVAIAREYATRSRNDRVYRPRRDLWGFSNGFTGGPAQPEPGTTWIVNRSELEGLRDAYSSAAVDPERALWRCGGCQAYYHEASVEVLKAQNSGCCALCGSPDLGPVRVV